MTGRTLSTLFQSFAKTNIIKFIDVEFGSLKDFIVYAARYEISELHFYHCRDINEDSDANILDVIAKICDDKDFNASLKTITFESLDPDYCELAKLKTKLILEDNITLITPNLLRQKKGDITRLIAKLSKLSKQEKIESEDNFTIEYAKNLLV